MSEQPDEKVGTPDDFARLFGAARADRRAEPEPEAEPTPEPELPMSAHADSDPPTAETAAPPASLEDLRREAGIRAGLPEELADSARGHDWAAIQAHAAELGEVWRRHVEKQRQRPTVSFDGGAREPVPAVSNGYAAHNNLIVDLITRSDSW